MMFPNDSRIQNVFGDRSDSIGKDVLGFTFLEIVLHPRIGKDKIRWAKTCDVFRIHKVVIAVTVSTASFMK